MLSETFIDREDTQDRWYIFWRRLIITQCTQHKNINFSKILSLKSLTSFHFYNSLSGMQHLRIIFLEFATDIFGWSDVPDECKAEKQDADLRGSAWYFAAQESRFTPENPKPSSSSIELKKSSSSSRAVMKSGDGNVSQRNLMTWSCLFVLLKAISLRNRPRMMSGFPVISVTHKNKRNRSII